MYWQGFTEKYQVAESTGLVSARWILIMARTLETFPQADLQTCSAAARAGIRKADTGLPHPVLWLGAALPSQTAATLPSDPFQASPARWGLLAGVLPDHINPYEQAGFTAQWLELHCSDRFASVLPKHLELKLCFAQRGKAHISQGTAALCPHCPPKHLSRFHLFRHWKDIMSLGF